MAEKFFSSSIALGPVCAVLKILSTGNISCDVFFEGWVCMFDGEEAQGFRETHEERHLHSIKNSPYYECLNRHY